MIKIAQVCHVYLPHIGGIEFYVQRLVSELTGKYDVTILTSDMGGTQKNNICPVFYFKAFPVILRNPFLFGLIGHLWKNKYDLVNVHQIWFMPSFIAAVLKGRSKMVATIHGVWPASTGHWINLFLWIYKPFAQFVIDRSDAIIVLTVEEKEKLLKKFNVDPDRVYQISNGICPEELDDSAVFAVADKYKLRDKKIIFFTGRILPDRNPEILLDCMSEVKHSEKDAFCVIAGPIDENYKKHLQEIIEKNKANDYCLLLEGLGRNELIAFYKLASVFISIGSWDCFPTRLLEAMYQGCASIVYDYGGASEIISQGQNGIIIDDLEANVLSKNIIKLLQDDELRKKIGLNARQTAMEKYMWSESAEKMESLYEKLLGNK